MLLREFIRRGSTELERLYPPREAEGIVFVLCEDILGVRRHTHILDPGFEIPQDKAGILENGLARLLKGEPVQYVTGKEWFCGHPFNVNPNVLIPRPETEYIVEYALDACLQTGGRPRVLDVCTGSGCIAWSIKLGCPEAEVVATDISAEALETARGQFPGPGPEFILSDLFDMEKDFDCALFDVIVSNPPYILESQKAEMRANVLDFEPGLALFVPDREPLLFHRAIAAAALKLLKPGGRGIVEINDCLGKESLELFRDAGFENCRIIADISHRDRFVSFCKSAY